MNEPKHTPLPWRLEDPVTVVGNETEDGLPNMVCNLDSEFRLPEGEANADLIVRAVNNFEMLLGSLSEAIALAYSIGDEKMAGRFEAALAKAKGNKP